MSSAAVVIGALRVNVSFLVTSRSIISSKINTHDYAIALYMEKPITYTNRKLSVHCAVSCKPILLPNIILSTNQKPTGKALTRLFNCKTGPGF